MTESIHNLCIQQAQINIYGNDNCNIHLHSYGIRIGDNEDCYLNITSSQSLNSL